MRRVIAPFSSLAFVCALALAAPAQVNPPVPPPSSGPVNPPGSVVTPSPGGSVAPAPVPPTESPASPAPTEPASPAPLATPTQPPIIVEPPQLNIEPGKTAAARVNGSLGAVTATVADPTVATIVIDQAQRVIYVSGAKVGTTTVTVTDSRGVTRDVAVRVAYAAGTVAEETTVRVTGNPTSAEYLRSAIADAVERAATLRSGASVNVTPETVPLHGDLKLDNRTEVDVPVQILGNGYLPVSGTTHVVVENTALPPIQPARLLVSDYPERLTANGVLFTARLDRTQGQRFLYYHYNPGTEPSRRILLKVRNTSSAPATVQMIDGIAGPGANEMEVGHLSTKRFLVREARNEGQVMTIAPGATMNVVDHPLPPQSVVSGILQLRLVSGDPVDLALVAQDALAPLDQSVDTTVLLAGGAPHARGVYPVPTFFFDRTYDVDGADLDIAIGQLPLPNLRQGEALSGDYGVEQSMSVVIVNMT
ncbi:MAG: hypothetical protein JWO66_354, partial [Candidatus Eremiobacteraeota bacterium]|nr:hypothetical protein [Candidatus Eremiobacteraeota bacterium]